MSTAKQNQFPAPQKSNFLQVAKQECVLPSFSPAKKNKFESLLCSAAGFVRITNLKCYIENKHLVLKHGDELQWTQWPGPAWCPQYPFSLLSTADSRKLNWFWMMSFPSVP